MAPLRNARAVQSLRPHHTVSLGLLGFPGCATVKATVKATGRYRVAAHFALYI
jgi:hypothetical protein